MTIQLRYYAQLRQWAGSSGETFSGPITTAGELWQLMATKHGFTFDQKLVKVAINDHYRTWDHVLNEGDSVVFIPPVAGG